MRMIHVDCADNLIWTDYIQEVEDKLMTKELKNQQKLEKMRQMFQVVKTKQAAHAEVAPLEEEVVEKLEGAAG